MREGHIAWGFLFVINYRTGAGNVRHLDVDWKEEKKEWRYVNGINQARNSNVRESVERRAMRTSGDYVCMLNCWTRLFINRVEFTETRIIRYPITRATIAVDRHQQLTNLNCKRLRFVA